MFSDRQAAQPVSLALPAAAPRFAPAAVGSDRPGRPIGWVRGLAGFRSDLRLQAIFWQVLIVGAAVAAGWYLASIATANLAQQHVATGFAFLQRTAGLPIGEHMIDYDPAINTHGRALLVGILNTLKVAAIGVVLSTLLGAVVGVAQLSDNWLLARLAESYVEVLRNIPLLLHLLFWYAILLSLPVARNAIELLPDVFLSNRGIRLPVPVWHPAYGWMIAVLAAGLAATVLAARRASRVQASTGRRPRIWPVACVALLVVPVATWMMLGAPFDLDVPVRDRFAFRGGSVITPELAALVAGLVFYHSAYAAEIVRSGVQSVGPGQWDAGRALGMCPYPIFSKIVLPQALRVIVPPMTGIYLGVAKNSSLAVAIGYPDVVTIVHGTMNQTGQAIEGVALIMLVYLGISLSISLFMNWYNARLALVER
ncbi:general L-amino acid transport system permease protein [Enhydrobacter aerosaccus]|uniref:General L-amino acid transport system permease protein n=1 Tax=Enhydrobacter aerosaccus TaxID=225324 RepID=A0A1T4P082_9HYPH|nr:ABC transporter permease subunit [Enhydrobacter aerosaccus]SJZ84974.1 general L-amino acid transport system permease protein [Enhydrobacter aerosaccus]